MHWQCTRKKLRQRAGQRFKLMRVSTDVCVAISSLAEHFPLFILIPSSESGGKTVFPRSISPPPRSNRVVREKNGSIFLRRGVYMPHGAFMGFLTLFLFFYFFHYHHPSASDAFVCVAFQNMCLPRNDALSSGPRSRPWDSLIAPSVDREVDPLIEDLFAIHSNSRIHQSPQEMNEIPGSGNQ